jgi:type III secretion protein C
MRQPSTGRTRPARRAAAIVLALAALATGAEAAPLALPAAPYRYTVIDQDLTAALQEFGSNVGVRVNISPEVRGRVQGPFPELTARAFLDRLLSTYNLDAYYDGAVLHVTSSKEVESRLLVLGVVPYDRFNTTLKAFQIIDERHTVQRAPDVGVALASGPPRFVALVEQTLSSLTAEEQARPKREAAPKVESTISVFRGSQAQVLRNGQVIYQSPEPPRPRLEVVPREILPREAFPREAEQPGRPGQARPDALRPEPTP